MENAPNFENRELISELAEREEMDPCVILSDIKNSAFIL
jgi:hypothetical protein